MDSTELKELAVSVKRGVRKLEKKLGPGWKRTMKTHASTFDIQNPNYCVLGTLEHHNGRMRQLASKRENADDGYAGGLYVFELAHSLDMTDKKSAAYYGFHAEDEYYPTLQALWEAEIGI